MNARLPPIGACLAKSGIGFRQHRASSSATCASNRAIGHAMSRACRDEPLRIAANIAKLSDLVLTFSI